MAEVMVEVMGEPLLLLLLLLLMSMILLLHLHLLPPIITTIFLLIWHNSWPLCHFWVEAMA